MSEVTPTVNLGLDFLKNKKSLTDETIKLFKLGFKKDNKIYGCSGLNIPESVSNNSIIIPIMDIQGNYYGYSTRNLLSETKYIHEKNLKFENILYGIDKTIENIIKLNCVVLVEGFFDMIALYQKGIINVVAVCGLNMSYKKRSILSRYCNNWVIAFDGDKPGIEAANCLKKSLDNTGINCHVFDTPASTDPDELDKGSWDKLWTLAQNTGNEIRV